MKITIPLQLALDWLACGKAVHSGVYAKIADAVEGPGERVVIDADAGELAELLAETEYAGWFQDGPYIAENRRLYRALLAKLDRAKRADERSYRAALTVA